MKWTIIVPVVLIVFFVICVGCTSAPSSPQHGSSGPSENSGNSSSQSITPICINTPGKSSPDNSKIATISTTSQSRSDQKNDQSTTYVNGGFKQLGLGLSKEALENFNSAIAINPANAEAWGGTGVALFRLGKSKEAMESFNTAISIDPYSPDKWGARSPSYSIPVVNKTTTGSINKNEIWRGEVHITGTITFAKDVTLVIEPGTIVYLASNSNDQHTGEYYEQASALQFHDPVFLESWSREAILISGRRGIIQAIGTPDNPIIIKPEGNSNSAAQWNGMDIDRGSVQYTRVYYAGPTAIQAKGDTSDIVEIAHNEVNYPHWGGIGAGNKAAWIHDNIIIGGAHQGIGARHGTIAENNTIMRAETGVNVEQADHTIVRNNTIIDCPLGIMLTDGHDVVVADNIIRKVNGYPDGFYYQGKLIYPAGWPGEGGWGGITRQNRVGGTVVIENNIVSL